MDGTRTAEQQDRNQTVKELYRNTDKSDVMYVTDARDVEIAPLRSDHEVLV